MEETELRARLQRLAERTAPPGQDPRDLTIAVVSRHSVERRRQGALATVAALLAATVGVPVWLSRTAEGPGPAGPATSSGVYTTPTRGSLSGEADFLDAMLRRPWTTDVSGSDVPEPPLETRRVVFAGENPAGRWVLVAGADPTAPPPDEELDPADLDELGSVAITWFAGPGRAAPEEMRVYGEPRIVDADEPTAVLSPTQPYGRSARSHFIVVAAPGDQVELSPNRLIAPDGHLFRIFDRHRTVDGVVASDAGQVDASVDLALRWRVVRGGTEFSALLETEPRADFVPPAVDLARLRPAPPPAPGDAAVASAIDTLISHLGVWAHVLDLAVLWAGDLPTPPAGNARVTVLASQYEDWGVYLAGTLGRDSGGGVSADTCGSEIRPAGTPLDEMVVVLRCGSDGDPEDAATDSLVVVAPRGATTARALDGRGELIASYPLVDGVAVVPVPPGLASVAVIGGDGETVDERAPMTEVDFGD